MTYRDVAKIVKMCQREGVKRISIAGDTVEVELFEGRTQKTKPAPLKETSAAPLDVEKMSDEDLMYWSASQ